MSLTRGVAVSRQQLNETGRKGGRCCKGCVVEAGDGCQEIRDARFKTGEVLGWFLRYLVFRSCYGQGVVLTWLYLVSTFTRNDGTSKSRDH